MGNMLAQSFAIYAPMYTYKLADLVLSARVFEADTNVILQGVLIRLRLTPVWLKQNLPRRM